MITEIPVDTGRLGQQAEPGERKGGWRLVREPADALWHELREAVARYDADQFATYADQSGVVRKHTRWEQGKLYGHMLGTAHALAYILAGHDYTFGNAAQVLISAASQANREAEAREEQVR